MRTAYLLAAFVLGACATAAVQSSAQPPEPQPNPTVAPEGWMPPVSPHVVKADIADVRYAPGDKGSVTILARGDNAFLARLELAADGAVPKHRDTTEEYIHVLSGAGTIIIDGTEHALAVGDTVYMPANAEVSYQNGSEPLVALQVFAGPEPAAKYGTWRAEPR